VASLTNVEFAERVGCDFTTSSRYRNGQRVPSYPMLLRIAKAFDLDPMPLVKACSQGPEAFGRLIRKQVFEAA
jgi:transcriptional regulator with XRE-family HTH domain